MFILIHKNHRVYSCQDTRLLGLEYVKFHNNPDSQLVESLSRDCERGLIAVSLMANGICVYC